MHLHAILYAADFWTSTFIRIVLSVNMVVEKDTTIELREKDDQLDSPVGDDLERTINPIQLVDSFHKDEAAHVIEEYTARGGAREWADSEERKLRRKIDARLLPVLVGTLVMQYYDKSIMAQAVRPAVN